ncbi:hypothetical protein MP228_000635 [Amoeboaphelidium protococcarum]|nr:hypothetical protein MP228_000635 [Amoeboaphelidium protococcarum]
MATQTPDILIKFESKSNRVKGVAFHQKRPWILASLHNGVIQLWDYRMGTLIDKFEEHDGPVRGISFHSSQPLFVSGGDDYKIKVWNYKQRRCLFTLTGHLDYIRTTFFHHEYPWIISASDDQTIRIWNWQSRSCVSILTGHNHYVMCAQFHPKEDLVVSASLDQTIRVWDIANLRKKNLTPQSQVSRPSNSFEDRMSGSGINQPGGNDPFMNNDVLVKYVLEGHERGVNWVSFHPTMPLIVSGADDRSVRIWRMSDMRAWEVETLRGHLNNVSCALFHPKLEGLVLSNAEDKTIRVWDVTKRSCLASFKRESDRFWVMAAHPTLNMFAAGHDNGLLVFKLERERPAYAITPGAVFYVCNKVLHMAVFGSNLEIPIARLKSNLSSNGVASALNSNYRSMHWNAAEGAFICCSNQDGGSFDVDQLPPDVMQMVNQLQQNPEQSAANFDPVDLSNASRHASGNTAIFVARNRYVVLNKSTQQLVLYNLNSDSSKTINISGSSQSNVSSPVGEVNGDGQSASGSRGNAIFSSGSDTVVNEIYFAKTGQILLSTSTTVVLYDLQQQKTMAELQVNNVKYAQWNQDGSMVALMSKHVIVIANAQLEQQSLIYETIRIKSGCWDESGLFIYTTLNHLKYALPNGDNGIIRTLDQPVYVVNSFGSQIHALNRDARLVTMNVDPTEYRFKIALVNKQYDVVLDIIRNSNLVGQSVIAYLRQKGYPEVALQFVQDPLARFDLALECGNLEVGVEVCKDLDREDLWNRLAAAAMKQGNVQIVEWAYQRTKNFEKLSFLYLLNGQYEKLRKMARIAEMRGDAMSRFQNDLVCGEVADQVAVLKESGQYALAYALAKRSGLQDEAAAILQAAGKQESDVQIQLGPGFKLPQPSAMVSGVSGADTQNLNWPIKPVSNAIFDI